jgi:predicted dehydrogenase
MAGANDRVRVAVCGIRGQGFAHVEEYSHLDTVEVAAVCDVDENIVRKRLADMERLGMPKPKVYKDPRQVMDDKSIDAVSVATPNHWHALVTIWACQAGKDVYVEKPCSHFWWEGRQMVRAAEKYDRIVQHGTNSRSNPAVREGIQKIREGLIGDVYLARGLCFNHRDTIGRAPVEPVPAGLDYDLWTGPAPKHEFTQNRFHYKWHWFWDYGNGDIGNQGSHQIDVARWGLGVGFPIKASAMGGHFMFDDDQETPNVLHCAFEFDGMGRRKMLEFEVRNWFSNHEAGIGTPGFGGELIPGFLGPPGPEEPLDTGGNTVGDIFYGSKGYMAVTNEEDYQGYRTWLGKEKQPGPSSSKRGNNWENFINCVRSRRKQDLNAPIQEAHISCTLLHLANASYRLGRTLQFDPEAEHVVGDEEANRLLRGAHREPFVIPENV